jgi:hypothetical protein
MVKVTIFPIEIAFLRQKWGFNRVSETSQTPKIDDFGAKSSDFGHFRPQKEVEKRFKNLRGFLKGFWSSLSFQNPKN